MSCWEIVCSSNRINEPIPYSRKVKDGFPRGVGSGVQRCTRTFAFASAGGGFSSAGPWDVPKMI